MKISGKDIDVLKKDEQYRVLEYIRMKKIKKLPLLSYVLIGCSKFEDSSDCVAYGGSVFNPSSQFYTIRLNWEKISNDNLPVEALEFIAYHNVLHHMLLHFVREPIVDYYKKSPHHADICMDTVVNEYLLHHLGFGEDRTVTHWVEENGFTYAKFLEYFQLSRLPFETDTIVSVEQLIGCVKDIEQKRQAGSSSEPSNQKESSSQILDDHGHSIDENEELKDKTAMSSGTLEELFMNSQDNIIERARKQGIIPAKEEERFVAILKTKVNYLSIVKLKNLSSSFSRGKQIRTWSKIHRHKKFFTGIHYPAKKIETKKHIVYAIDSSGSVSDDELQSVKSVIFNHAKQHEDEIVCDIIVWSGMVTNEYRNVAHLKNIITLRTTTTWSTNIDKLFEHIKNQYTKKIICVILTDGYIRQETIPPIIEKVYFALTKQESLASVKNMYPTATTLSLII
ncbi:hypothetical protein CCP3SC15_60002 [Gammaproteobacteria bacterium]